MPDRYGENDDRETLNPGYPQAVPAVDAADDFGPEYRQRAQDAIDACELCDHDGLRNGFPCDHVDYGAIAKRGIDAVRAALRKEAR